MKPQQKDLTPVSRRPVELASPNPDVVGASEHVKSAKKRQKTLGDLGQMRAVKGR